MDKKVIFDHYHKDDLVGTVIVDFEEEVCYSKRNGKLFYLEMVLCLCHL